MIASQRASTASRPETGIAITSPRISETASVDQRREVRVVGQLGQHGAAAVAMHHAAEPRPRGRAARRPARARPTRRTTAARRPAHSGELNTRQTWSSTASRPLAVRTCERSSSSSALSARRMARCDDRLDEQRLARREVVHERALRDLRALGDAPRGQRRVALVDEAVGRPRRGSPCGVATRCSARVLRRRPVLRRSRDRDATRPARRSAIGEEAGGGHGERRRDPGVPAAARGAADARGRGRGGARGGARGCALHAGRPPTAAG